RYERAVHDRDGHQDAERRSRLTDCSSICSTVNTLSVVCVQMPSLGCVGAVSGVRTSHGPSRQLPRHRHFVAPGLLSSGYRRHNRAGSVAGLLVSMHGVGIYWQRYGSDPNLKLTREPEALEAIDPFVAEQEAGYPVRIEALGL